MQFKECRPAEKNLAQSAGLGALDLLVTRDMAVVTWVPDSSRDNTAQSSSTINRNTPALTLQCSV